VIARSFGEIFFSNCFQRCAAIQLDGDEMSAVKPRHLDKRNFCHLSPSIFALQSRLQKLIFAVDPYGKAGAVSGTWMKLIDVLLEDCEQLRLRSTAQSSKHLGLFGRRPTS